VTVTDASDKHADTNTNRGFGQGRQRDPCLVPGISVSCAKDRVGQKVVAYRSPVVAKAFGFAPVVASQRVGYIDWASLDAEAK
jgi:hypothetical protein